MSITEIWKDVKGFEGEYEISNLGKIRSKDRIVHIIGHVLKDRSQFRKGRMLKKRIHRFGYECIVLKKKQYYIHRLVAIAFITNPKKLPQVDHIDGNRSNSYASNLRWCTSKENCNYQISRIRRRRRADKDSIPVIQYSMDGEFIKEWKSISFAEHSLGLTKGNVCKCCKGKVKQAYGFIWKYKNNDL